MLVQVEVALTDGTDLKAFRRGHPVLLGDAAEPVRARVLRRRRRNRPARRRRQLAPAGDERGGDRCDCSLLNGAYAEYVLVPERIARVNLLPVPPGIAAEVAAMVEPLACCLHGVERAGRREGRRVAILGAGPIGLMLCACVADAGGTAEVVGGRPGAARARAGSSAARPATARAPTS